MAGQRLGADALNIGFRAVFVDGVVLHHAHELGKPLHGVGALIVYPAADFFQKLFLFTLNIIPTEKAAVGVRHEQNFAQKLLYAFKVGTCLRNELIVRKHGR